MRMVPLANDPYCWAYEIINFFEIHTILDIEKKSALRIENFLINCKKTLIKQKFKKIIYKLKNMVTNVIDLPYHILINIFSYFEIKERFKF